MCTNFKTSIKLDQGRQQVKECQVSNEITLWALIPLTSAVVAKYGVVDPPAELGHSSVDSRKLGISTPSAPRHHAIDPAITHEWTTWVPLEETSGMTEQSDRALINLWKDNSDITLKSIMYLTVRMPWDTASSSTFQSLPCVRKFIYWLNYVQKQGFLYKVPFSLWKWMFITENAWLFHQSL